MWDNFLYFFCTEVWKEEETLWGEKGPNALDPGLLACDDFDSVGQNTPPADVNQHGQVYSLFSTNLSTSSVLSASVLIRQLSSPYLITCAYYFEAY